MYSLSIYICILGLISHVLSANIHIEPDIYPLPRGNEPDISPTPRIQGGLDVINRTEANYQVSVQLKGEIEPVHICGGALIGNQHVLTAASCIYKNSTKYDPTELVVFAGHNYLYDEGETINVDLIHIHPGFKPLGRVQDNLAVLKLISSFELGNKTQKIEMRKNEALLNEACIMTGWGEIGNSETSPLSNLLQKRPTTITNFTLCKETISTHGITLNKTTLCSNSGFCKKDIGGPLACEGLLTGIASFHENPDNTCGTIGVFSNINLYTTWINQAVSQGSIHHISLSIFVVIQTILIIFFNKY